MKRPLGFLFLVFMISASASAGPVIDDSDLGGKALSLGDLENVQNEGRLEGRSRIFPLLVSASPAGILGGAKAVAGTLQLSDRNGVLHPARLARVRLVGPGASGAWAQTDDSGRFSLPAEGLSGSYRLKASLDNSFWAFFNTREDASYEWEGPAFTLTPDSGLDLGELRPDPSSANGKLGVLHLTYLEALDFLKAEADLGWWKNPLTVNWPSNGDFFSPWGWSLNISNPLAWDVVLHELGHAVQHGAMKAASAGGEHKIDQCYSPALAWSEGWATFFAAAVRLNRGAADAKFEFLVPRRAPIRIENVPEDVCQGESSEWRVAAGLWDLIDTHNDGLDQFSMSFPQLWKGLRGQSMGSMSSAWAIIAKTLSPDQRQGADAALRQNTLIQSKPALSVALPKIPIDWLDKARSMAPR